ncbi:MAG: hypothetical protein B7X07_05605 [Actinobacteria bacterium 21-64-8]|nr:MAG: hypothetical protein B7X07_05605 [Actinobacteria bacterium 21-64-8]
MGNVLLQYATVLVLSIFVGIEIIAKVPSILHTPLMSGSNAIHGVILVGSMLRPKSPRRRATTRWLRESRNLD